MVEEGDERRPRARWGVGLAVAGLVGGILASSVMATVAVSAGAAEDGVGALALAQLGLWAGFGAAAAVAARRSRAPVAEALGLRFGWRDAAVGVPLGMGGQLVGVPLVALVLRPLVGSPDVEGPVRDLVEGVRGTDAILVVVLVGLGAPIMEELFYRWVLLRPLEARLGRTAGLVLTSALFGLSHFNPELSGSAQVLVVVTLSAFGAVLALVVQRTGRLGLAMVTHAAFNATTLVALL